VIRAIRTTLVLVTVNAVLLAAQGSANARFQYERVAEVTSGGPQRLDVDVALLAGSEPPIAEDLGGRSIARRGFADLRLFDSNNIEVPYLLIAPTADQAALSTYPVLPISPVEKPGIKTSGFEVDARGVRTMNALLLDAIRGPFLKRFRLEGSGDRERWTELIHEGTAFSLPAERVQHTLIEFEAGDYRYLRVTWDDTNSGRVPTPDSIAVREPRPMSAGPVVRSRVSIARRPSEPGRSRFRLTLPAARLPIVALELSVEGGNLLREVRVLEAGFSGQGAEPRLIGGGRITRVVRDTLIAESLRIPTRQPAEPQLDLVVDDGDNPPLELEGVTAVFAEMPWIYFESPPGPITVRYGNARLTAPRYDLEAARANLPKQPNRAAWRSQPPVTLAVDEVGLPMPETGSAMSTERFEYVRDIPAGPPGLIAVQMDLAAVAHSGRDTRRFRDVRILDRSGLQIPYLLEARDEPLMTDLRIERKALPADVEQPQAGVTAYLVHVPFHDLPDPTLVLTTKARVFTRTIAIGTVVPGSERQKPRYVRRGSATWIHADQDVAAPALSLALPDSAANEDVYVLIDEGDNQSLPIDKATLLVPQHAIRLFRKADQPLRLLYGRDDLDAPRYDLQLLSGQVLGRVAEDVTAGEERPLGTSAGGGSLDPVPPAVFWAALALTVVVLLGFVVRLMKREAI
jgi:hypothetical protein